MKYLTKYVSMFLKQTTFKLSSTCSPKWSDSQQVKLNYNPLIVLPNFAEEHEKMSGDNQYAFYFKKSLFLNFLMKDILTLQSLYDVFLLKIHSTYNF